MATQTASRGIQVKRSNLLSRQQWIVIGLTTALVAAAIVLAAMAVALSIWPETAAFKPLDSYIRTAIFTIVPALIATALFARLARNGKDPVVPFVKIAFVVLLLSFIPDYLLPDANKTFLASSIAAFLHIVAAVVISGGLITGYRRVLRKG